MEAGKSLPPTPQMHEALANLQWLAGHLRGAKVSFDLADMRGYAYYTGARFAIYTPGASDALVRGGRYDEVGAVFGRKRPAAGFSLDVKELVAVVAKRPLKAVIRMRQGHFQTKNEVEFRLYRKFTAEASITFDYDTPAPLPEEKTEEQPAVK